MGRTTTAVALLAVLVCCTGCNLLAPPPSALPPPAPPLVAAPVVAAPAAPKMGVLGRAACGVRILIDRIRNRLGMRFPGLEAKPPLTAIADPANAESPVPAVATAAKVKAEEDAAEQKIKAIRYLASVGCTDCYPDIEKALLAALDDCTEAVRYEAVKAIRKTTGDPCRSCRATHCCKPEILARLQSMAYDLKDACCYQEPSDRVRRLARLVLSECRGAVIAPTGQPAEGPRREVAETFPVAQSEPTPVALSYGDGLTVGTKAVLRPEDRPMTPAIAASPQLLTPDGDARALAPEIRWEQMTAARTRFASAAQARQSLAYLRDLARGVSATRPAEFDPKAVTVRNFDWMRREDVASDAIGRVLFNLPPEYPSEIIEDETGWHVVLVHQRRPVPDVPSGSGVIPAAASRIDRAAENHQSAYLDVKLFSETPPLPTDNKLRRPTRIASAEPPEPADELPRPAAEIPEESHQAVVRQAPAFQALPGQRPRIINTTTGHSPGRRDDQALTP